LIQTGCKFRGGRFPTGIGVVVGEEEGLGSLGTGLGIGKGSGSGIG